MVDKNLFPYDLAVVAIMKNEAPYIKEWLDYHLLAGVKHFFLYDNESSDNLKEVLQPYLEKGLVTKTVTSIWNSGIPAYNDAVEKFKFFCRYILFLDLDEFVLPKDNRSIVEVLDEIFALDSNAGGVLFNWHCFGSNGQEKTDLSRGVLERFTRRAEHDWYEDPNEERKLWLGNIHVKTAVNPRQVAYITSPHFAMYFTGINTIDEDGAPVRPSCFKLPITAKRMVVNHYCTKSHEEFVQRRPHNKFFYELDRNEIFDDGILKYRDARKAAGGGIENVIKSNQVNYPRLVNALAQNVIPVLSDQTPEDFFTGKVENFLTCLNLISYLKESIMDDKSADTLEELSLISLYKAISIKMPPAEFELLFREMPKILLMPYPVVEKICVALIETIQQILKALETTSSWQKIWELKHELEILKIFNDIVYK